MPSAEQEKLKQLQEKILRAKGGSESTSSQTIKYKNLSYVWRMVLELVVGMVLGFGIGYFIDYWLDTKPVMMILMSLFGFAAGIKTMMKTASEISGVKDKRGDKYF